MFFLLYWFCFDVYWLEFAGEDDVLAALEATYATDDLAIVGPGVGIATDLDPDRLQSLALTRTAGPLVSRTNVSVDDACQSLKSASLDRSGTVAVRARDVRAQADIDTQRAERKLGSVLVDRGFSVDLDNPDHVLRVLFADGNISRDPAADPTHCHDPMRTGYLSGVESGSICVIGWSDHRTSRDFHTRMPTDRPFFQPGSMDPQLARTLVTLAGVTSDDRFLDPMCGTGGTLIESGLIGAECIGCDVQLKMVNGTRENLIQYLSKRQTDVFRADATKLPFCNMAVDAVAFDVPYGRQSVVEGETLSSLVNDTLAEVYRVTNRAVIVADQSWKSLAESVGWSVPAVLQRYVHGSLTRYIHLLEKPE